MNNNYVIIAAAGKGSRMGREINKQFIPINGKPIIYYTLKAFSDNEFIDGIIIAAAKDEIEYINTEILKKFNIPKVIKVVEGGNSRQVSVYNALKEAKGCKVVIIHDGARPFVSNQIINDGIKYALCYGACACGVPLKDTIKVKGNDNFSKNTLQRENLFCVQTPQCFQYDVIWQCHKEIASEKAFSKTEFTDDTAVVEKFGHKVFLYEGSYNNIKITTPEDIFLAEKIIERNMY